MDSMLLVTSIPLFLFIGVLVFIDVGFRIGKRKRSPAAFDESTTVDAAVFGLLGLTLAFTFGGASDRLTVRRAQIVQEANAIGTAYLRVDMLPGRDQPLIKALFREYLEARIEIYDSFLDRAASKAALDRANELQREIWSNSVASARKAPDTSASMLLLPALNDMIDITTVRTMAAFTHAPTVILALLVILSLLAAVLFGSEMASQPQRNLLQMVLFSLAVSSTVYVVLDLEYPRVGLINLSSMDQAIVQLRETMMK